MKSWILAAFSFLAIPLSAQEPFINELHYDNTGGDTGEGVEIAAAAGKDLAGYRLDFYNGNGGALYNRELLSGVVPDDTGNGFGAVWFGIAGIQNGPDAVVLVSPDGTVLEAISYEGTLTVGGVTTTDIGVAETSSTPVGRALGLVGTGRERADFSWASGLVASPGTANPGQTASGDAVPRTTLALGPESVVEGEESVTLTVTLQPPPAAPVTVGLAADPPGRFLLPERVEVDGSGESSMILATVSDGVPAGATGVIVVASPGGGYPPAEAAFVLDDAEAVALREGSFRLATLNVENGTGAPGGRASDAVVSLLKRIDADVIGLQEVEDGFAELAAAGDAAGYPYLAFGDDRFGSAAFSSGDFGSGQNLAVLSRYPITETEQIGRDDGNTKEHARFPLFVRVDVPGVPADADPAIVVAHYKASGDDASSYRRSVETFRTVEFLQAKGLGGDTANVFVIGDLNEDVEDFQPVSFPVDLGAASGIFGDGSTLPVSYQIGADLVGVGARTLVYRAFPRAVFAEISVREQPAFQLDGIDRTRAENSPRRLDYILVPDRVIAAGNAPQEVYNSLLETISPGLPKAGLPLAPPTSRDAADHQMVFGDFELVAKPGLDVAVSPGSLDEGSPAEVTVTLPAAAEVPVTVQLAVAPFFEALPEAFSLTFLPGETAKTLVVTTPDDAAAEPDQGVVFAAAAPGYSTAYTTLDVRNLDPGSAMVFTQVSEQTGNGSNRLAIELTNTSGGRIDFRETPLSLRSFDPGERTFSRPVQIEDGALPPGGTVVIGESFAGNVIVANPSPAFSSAFDNTPYLNGVGELVFIYTTQVVFDGDEAQELLLGNVRQDVFGRIGEDPGLAWVGNGVETRNQNLERLPYATGGSAGWSDPSVRFFRNTGAGALDGIGVAPVLDGDTDSDGDGVTDFLEFAAATDPGDPASNARMEVGLLPGSVAATIRERADTPDVVRTFESSEDLVTWSPTDPAVLSRTPIPGGAVLVVREIPLAPGRNFLRVRTSLF